jgi:hypothetical protein
MGWRWWGFGPTRRTMTMMVGVEERIRFLMRTALRAEGTGDLGIAELFRRMAEDMRSSEGALIPSNPVLGGSRVHHGVESQQ